RVFMENERALGTNAMQQIQQWEVMARQKVFDFAIKFQPQLQQYFRVNQLPELNETLQERIKKASVYFATQIQDHLLTELTKTPIRSDNSKVREQAVKAARQLEKSLFVKHKCFLQAQNGFVAQEYLKIRANANIDYNTYKAKQAAQRRVQFVPPSVQHPELYAQLDHWRNETATLIGAKPFEVFPLKSLQDFADNLPLDKKNLLKVSGIGRYKAEKYGAELLHIIQNYADEKGIAGNLFAATRKPTAAKKSKKPKIDTKKVSYDLFKSGKSVAEIAQERELVAGTIEGHLAHYVAQGELKVEAVVAPERITEITEYLKANPDYGLADAKKHFGEKYSYGELRLVRDSLPKE
ncbi:MAG: helix-turn-helix domain-containing protein, partial [Saprospiraceae bacterium]